MIISVVWRRSRRTYPCDGVNFQQDKRCTGFIRPGERYLYMVGKAFREEAPRRARLCQHCGRHVSPEENPAEPEQEAKKRGEESMVVKTPVLTPEEIEAKSNRKRASYLRATLGTNVRILWSTPYASWQDKPAAYQRIMGEIRNSVTKLRQIPGYEGMELQVVDGISAYFDKEGNYIWPEEFKNSPKSVLELHRS